VSIPEYGSRSHLQRASYSAFASPALDSFKIAKVEDDLEIQKSDYCKNMLNTTCTGDGLYPPTTLLVALS